MTFPHSLSLLSGDGIVESGWSSPSASERFCSLSPDGRFGAQYGHGSQLPFLSETGGSARSAQHANAAQLSILLPL